MVLSIVGKDRPGLVDELASAVISAKGNWLRSSFCQLSGHFAGFVEIMLQRDNHQQLIDACQQLQDIQITLLPASESDNTATTQILLKVTGNDRAGIVSDVTGALKRFDLNIQELSTVCESAPNWGNLLFSATMRIQAPLDFDAQALSHAIEEIADDLMVDLQAN